jgi:hypothetical protein
MRATVVVCLLAALATAAAVAPPPPEPDFCRGLDCPAFTTVTKGNGFDVRDYPDAKWTSITVRVIATVTRV